MSTTSLYRTRNKEETNVTILEHLPNEILLILFEYFNGIDLLQTFYDLNSHLNLLLYKQFQLYCFNFKSISKCTFDLICQQHLPFIANKVISLAFSDYRDTPKQMSLFFSYIPSLHRFTQLQSLTLSNIHSYDTVVQFLNECHYLYNLIHLTFYFYSFLTSSVDLQLIIDKIWSLPKLTYCHFDVRIERQPNFCLPTIISSSLKYLYLPHSKLQWNQVNRLFHYVPELKHLSILNEPSVVDNYILLPPPGLIKLNFYCPDKSIISKLDILLQNMSNLYYLHIRLKHSLINGYKWEQIIRIHLPKLKIFRLRMNKAFFNNPNIQLQRQVDKLINSFRSSFWINERQWFFRCFTWKKIIVLHSLCSTYNYHGCITPDFWQSTSPHDNQQQFHNEITSIDSETFLNELVSLNICLSNIDHLTIKLPINEKIWSIFSNFNRLHSLTVLSHTDTFQFELQILLDRAPHLRILRLGQDGSLPLHLSLFNYRNTSVRELNLIGCDYCFNEEECILFSHSSLGVQCEVLFIEVNNRETIIHLVKHMIKLRVLYICYDDGMNWENLKMKTAEQYDECYKTARQMIDQLVQWLKDHLPSTYLVINDPHYSSNVISIWI
ncbi:unnamed protein product [Rotaria sp. Silwood1]|nr:unnamed protein product [Rotaria sp. Silwood1]CAF4908412.1 unnamed protein product [Rotaria sp. Silwood1]